MKNEVDIRKYSKQLNKYREINNQLLLKKLVVKKLRLVKLRLHQHRKNIVSNHKQFKNDFDQFEDKLKAQEINHNWILKYMKSLTRKFNTYIAKSE